MFSFQKFGKDESMEELREFTMNLLKKTRPYLNEAQSKILAEDLISRAQATVTEPPCEREKTPYIFNGNYRREEYISYKVNKENMSPPISLTDAQKTRLIKKSQMNPVSSYMEDKNYSRKRTHIHSSSTSPHLTTTTTYSKGKMGFGNKCSPSTSQRRESVSQKIFQTDLNSGAPTMKKKRYRILANESNNSSGESNVFERLYAARKKVETIPFMTKKPSWVKHAEPDVIPKVVRQDSMDVCVGSVQKALQSLKLELSKL